MYMNVHSVLLSTANAATDDYLGTMTQGKARSPRGTSFRFPSCARIADWGSRSASCYSRVSSLSLQGSASAHLGVCAICGIRIEEAMASVYKAAYVMLHVRKSNRAALSLYKDSLGFRVHGTEKNYCASSSALRSALEFTLCVHRRRRGGCIRDAM